MRTSGYHKICERWVPQQLTDVHRWACVETYMQYYPTYSPNLVPSDYHYLQTAQRCVTWMLIKCSLEVALK